MEQQKAIALAPEIEAVRKRIEEWRRTREKRTRMPEELWQAAVALAVKYGMWRISQDLRVTYQGLKTRMKASEADVARKKATFIELAPALASPPSGGVATTVELSRPDGTRLSLRFPSTEGVDFQSLVAAFSQASS